LACRVVLCRHSFCEFLLCSCHISLIYLRSAFPLLLRAKSESFSVSCQEYLDVKIGKVVSLFKAELEAVHTLLTFDSSDINRAGSSRTVDSRRSHRIVHQICHLFILQVRVRLGHPYSIFLPLAFLQFPLNFLQKGICIEVANLNWEFGVVSRASQPAADFNSPYIWILLYKLVNTFVYFIYEARQVWVRETGTCALCHLET